MVHYALNIGGLALSVLIMAAGKSASGELKV